MEHSVEDKAIEMLKRDEDFQKALQKYQDAEEESSKRANELSLKLVSDMGLQNPEQTLEQARHNLIIAKMTAAKVLATLSSFSYEEKDFMESLQKARECVQTEIVQTLMQKEPCGECEACKNGHPDRCIRPNVREDYCESRFLPLLADALIEYDAWSEILYNHIPADKRDIDILKDINDEFQNTVNQAEQPKKRRGRPPKQNNDTQNNDTNEGGK